jgi:hypothetical protein
MSVFPVQISKTFEFFCNMGPISFRNMGPISFIAKFVQVHWSARLSKLKVFDALSAPDFYCIV